MTNGYVLHCSITGLSLLKVSNSKGQCQLGIAVPKTQNSDSGENSEAEEAK